MEKTEQQPKPSFLELLNQAYQWPSVYPFKFIVPIQEAKNLELHFAGAVKTEIRLSANGNYQAYTFHMMLLNGAEVLETLKKVASIPGLISL